MKVEKNVLIEYKKQGERVYALIYDGDGNKIWRSRGGLNELPQVDQNYEKFYNIDEFIKYVEKIDFYKLGRIVQRNRTQVS